ETLSTALPLQEENEKPDPIEIRDAGLYLGGISRRNFEILLSSVIGMIVVVLTWLLHGTESKDIGTKIMQLPIAFMLALCGSHAEQCSEDRRCGVLRETVHNILKEAFESYCDAIVAMNPETLKENLVIMYNMYNIIPRPEGDEWFLEEHDTLSLEHLKQCFQKVHTKRRELLCHFLALDVMTPGRDSGRRDYEHHWAIVNEHLNNLGVITGIYLDRIIAASAIDLCMDVSDSEREQLIKQYETISNDFVYVFQEWEDGKRALKDVTEPIPVDPDLSSSRQSLEEDTETLQDENDQDENRSEKTLTIDWSQIDEPLDILEQVFEAEAKAKPEEFDSLIQQKFSSENKVLQPSPEEFERIQMHGSR
ncbi:8228_t:CDS:2, partial [Racocetra fulgida]